MENNIINLLLNHGTFSGRTFKPILYHTVKTVHSIHVGQKFEDYQAFQSAIELQKVCSFTRGILGRYKKPSRVYKKKGPSHGSNQRSPVLVRYTSDWTVGVGSANGCNIYCDIWLNEWSISPFQQYVSNIALASAPIDAFLEFLKPILGTILFLSHWLLSHITIVETMGSGERKFESCHIDYRQSSERILGEPGIEPANSCSPALQMVVNI